MKKNLIIILALAFVIGAVPVFGQHNEALLNNNWWKENQYMQIVNILNMGRPAEVVFANGTKATITKKSSDSILVGKFGGYFTNSEAENKRISYIETHGCEVHILFWKDVKWYSPSESKRLVKFEKDAKVNFRYNTLSKNSIEFNIEKGNGRLDRQYTTAAQLEEVMLYVSSVNKDRIKADVERWRKERKDKDQLADYVISVKTDKAGLIGTITGLGGLLLLPAEFARVLTQWLIQSELAYAMACVYNDKPPSQDEFLSDLYILFAGEEYAKTALKELGQSTALEVTEISARKIAGNTKNYTTSIQKSLKGRLLAKASTVSSAVAKGAPVVGAVMDGTSSTSDARTFGQFAKKYYRK